MPTMTTEHSTNLILDDLASRNLNWLGLNYVLAGSTAIPLAMSSGVIGESAFSSGTIDASAITLSTFTSGEIDASDITLSTFTSGDIVGSSIKRYTEPYVTIPTTGGALTIDLSSGNVFKINMTSTITSITYSGDSTSETVPFTLQFYPLSTAALTITGQTPYSVCSASTALTATSSCGFTGVFSTLIEAGDIIDVSGFSTATNNTDWHVISATTAFISVYGSSGLTSTSSTNGTISRRRDIFAGGSSGFTAPTPYTPTAYVGYTFDGDLFYMAAVGDY